LVNVRCRVKYFDFKGFGGNEEEWSPQTKAAITQGGRKAHGGWRIMLTGCRL
jgi:hypothetical protein